jgi:hypothetical protein
VLQKELVIPVGIPVFRGIPSLGACTVVTSGIPFLRLVIPSGIRVIREIPIQGASNSQWNSIPQVDS